MATHIGLLFIDIDGFKAINDRHGHKVGDTVLTEIARRFKDVSRESDVLARFGGDEFVLAAPNTQDRHELVHVAQRLIASLSNPRLPPLSDIAVGASIGVAFFPDDATDLRGPGDDRRRGDVFCQALRQESHQVAHGRSRNRRLVALCRSSPASRFARASGFVNSRTDIRGETIDQRRIGFA